MGVYIYSVRTREIPVNLDGETVTVRPLSYLDKPSWPSDRRTRLLVGKAESVFAGTGITLQGSLVVLCHKTPVDGDAIVRYRYASPCCYDSESFGEVIGYIRKVGRTWTVAKAIYQGRVGTDREGVFYVRESSPIFFAASEAVAWAKASVKPGEVARLDESDSEGRKTVFERVAAPDSETINDIGNVLLHGPYPCNLLAERDASRAQAADALVSRGWAEIHAEAYTGEGEAPHWHGKTYYRLTLQGLAKLAGLDTNNYRLRFTLTTQEVVFSGGKFGSHGISRTVSSLERVKAHWEGYCAAQQQSA